MQALEAFHTAALVATREGPAGAAERDHHHRMLCALRELAGDIAQRALVAAEIETRLAQSEDDEDEIE